MKRIALLALTLAMVSMVFMACSSDDDPVVPNDPTTTVAIMVMDMAGAWDGMDLVIDGSLVNDTPMALTQDGPMWTANVTGIKTGDYMYGIFLDDGSKALVGVLEDLDIVVASDLTVTGDTEPTLEPTAETGFNLMVINHNPTYVNIKFKGTYNDWTVDRSGMNADGTYFYFHVHPDSVEAESDHEWGAIEDDGTEWGVWLIEGDNPTFTIDADGLVSGTLTYTIPAPPPVLDVTFTVDMNGETVSGDGVHMAGGFGGDGYAEWSPNEITLTDDDEDGIYSITLTLGQDSIYEFKFINGIIWDDQEQVPADCGVDDENGGYNRSQLTGTTGDETWDFVFGACNER